MDTLGTQDALAPQQQTIRIRGAHPLFGLDIERSKLQTELTKHDPGFPFLTSLLTSLLTPLLERLLPELPVPTVDAVGQHGFHLLQGPRGGDFLLRQSKAKNSR